MKNLLSSFAWLLLVACGQYEEKPDVVLITMDTTRADHLSCYGFQSDTPATPVLDALAAEGTRFDLAMATASVTPVSHAAIMTGQFNRGHGVRVIYAGSGFRLPDDVPTLATEFQANGYHTIAVHSSFTVSPRFGLAHGFDVLESCDSTIEMKQGAVRWDSDTARRSDDTIDLVLEKLEEAESPTFLWIHLWDPHDRKQVPPQEWLPPPGELFEYDANGNIVLSAPDTPKMRQRAIYTAEIRFMDAQIGRLFEYLKKKGRWNDSIMVVTADHGQGLGDHDWRMHGLLYQEQIHVPLIIRVPGGGQRRVVSELARTVDIAPTLLDYAGLSVPSGVAGLSLRSLIESKTDEPRIHFAEQINGYDLNARMLDKRPLDDFIYCAMDGEWKLTWRPNHPAQSELFDLSADPHESRNLWAWDHPEALRLKKELARHAPWVTRPFPESEDRASAEAAAEALRKLGYTGGDDDEGTDPGPQWEYVCPVHYDQRSPEREKCPECREAKILIAEGK